MTTLTPELVREFIEHGTPGQKARLRWLATARPAQIPPASVDWDVWLYLAGRGVGKTRAAAEWLAEQMRRRPGTRWAIVAPTFGDGRDVCVEGETGLIAALAGDVAYWNRSQGHLLATSGAQCQVFPAAVPDRLRGPQHHGAWCDEAASWAYPEAWDQLQFGLRLGDRPQCIVTTTPRPVSLVRRLMDRAHAGDGVVMRHESTFDNAANLPPSALAELKARYEGTRLGRQELYGELLLDTPGALWTPAMFDREGFRVDKAPELKSIVVAIDPAVTAGEDSDSTGIVAVGVDYSDPPHYYVLADRTLKASPSGWARVAVDLYSELDADLIVGEVNNGGDMVGTVLRAQEEHSPHGAVFYKSVVATRGKQKRAEGPSILYEKGEVHHVGRMDALEDQLVSWAPDAAWSPDRMDALVWALSSLAFAKKKRRRSTFAAGVAA